MNQQRDLDRTHSPRTAPAHDDDGVAPGRGSRSSQLAAPAHPLASGLVQRKGDGAGAADPAAVHQAAAHGLGGAATSLPHLDQIQRAFGPDHDVSGVSAHIGGAAAEACDAMGASAYASGNAVAFRAFPDLHTAAHEAAHVVQQKQGVSLYGGVGAAGDVYERHADAVADRVVAGQSAADLLAGYGSGGARSAAVQRKASDDAPAGGDAPSGGGGAAAPAGKTADILLSAIYEEVPGEAKDKVRRAKGDEAVWLDPLHFFSNFPQEKRATRHVGVVAGGGERAVDTFAAPISGGVSAHGRGSITAQLKYAGNTKKSFNVTVTGLKKALVDEAEAKARRIIEREVALLGDVEDIIATAEADLNADPKFQGAKVSIQVHDHKTQQQGSTTFNYKVRSNAGIRMDLLAQPIGGKTATVGGSKTVDGGTEDETTTRAKDRQESEQIRKTEQDRYKKTDTSTETHDVNYYKNVTRTLDDYVKRATENHTDLARILAETVTEHGEVHYTDKDITKSKQSNFTNWTKDSKHTVESGERDKENWAAKLKKGIGLVQRATDIPFISKIPKVGKWISRRVKGWGIGLDLLDAGLGLFEEKGTVKFTDTNLDEKVESKGGSTHDSDRDRKVDRTEDNKKDVQSKLTENYVSKTKDVWQQHLKDVTETRETYSSKIEKDAQTTVDKDRQEDYKRDAGQSEKEQETRHKDRKNQTTTTTFTTTYEWKFTKPQVKASVVSGDAEVSNDAFGPEPGEEAPGSTTK